MITVKKVPYTVPCQECGQESDDAYCLSLAGDRKVLDKKCLVRLANEIEVALYMKR